MEEPAEEAPAAPEAPAEEAPAAEEPKAEEPAEASEVHEPAAESNEPIADEGDFEG